MAVLFDLFHPAEIVVLIEYMKGSKNIIDNSL